MQCVSTVVLRLKQEKFKSAVKICDLSCYLAAVGVRGDVLPSVYYRAAAVVRGHVLPSVYFFLNRAAVGWVVSCSAFGLFIFNRAVTGVRGLRFTFGLFFLVLSVS